jgi:hypothetical protein
VKDFDYEQLDPGIRETVRYLHGCGFITADSGDGSKYPEMECAIPQPMVVCDVTEHGGYYSGLPLYEAGRLQSVLDDLEPGWRVELTYSPQDNLCLLVAIRYGTESK